MQSIRSNSTADFLSVSDITNDQLQHIFQKLDSMQQSSSPHKLLDPTLLQGSVMTPMFETASIRSKSGFCSAFLKLGGAVLDIEKIESRLFDGESQESTEQIVSYLSVYCDVIVFRCHQTLLANAMVNHSKVPVISAGISGGEHPITGLAHLYSIQRDTGRLTDHDVLFIASCNSTSIASIHRGLSRYLGNKFTILTPAAQPSLSGSSNLVWHEPIETSLRDLDLSNYTLVLIDESERANLSSDIVERMQFGIMQLKSAASLERIAHIKPVLKLLDGAMKENLQEDCLEQSRLSYFAKFLVFEQVLKKHIAN